MGMHALYADNPIRKGRLRTKMLKRTWSKGFRAARSSEGYSINLRGTKYGLEYREHDRVMQIHVERAAVEVDWSIYPESIRSWLPPHQDEPISDEKRRQILERIVSALNFLAVKYRVAD
jgi:hypothetical protein